MDTYKEVTVGGVNLKWDLEKGEVLFEGGDVVLFWNTSMKSLFDTIKEISGEEAANLVLETTAFRQGLIVGKEFRKMKKIDASNVVEWLTNTYATAGWGKFNIKEMNPDENTFTIEFNDDWEYKMNQIGSETTEGNFVPAHFAGVFSGLFGRDYWYHILEKQSDEYQFSVVQYFQTQVDIKKSILDLARRKEAALINQLESMVEEKTKMFQELIKELSSPLIPVLDGIVVVPLIGRYDEERAEYLMMNTLLKLPKHQAEYLLLDLTGINGQICENTGAFIEKLGLAANLLGTQMILVGISAEMAINITQSLTNLSKFECLPTLQHGINYALEKAGKRIV